MSYLSLLKSLPNNLRQPAGIAFIASIGVHGLVGISFPLLSSSETDTPDQQQKVQVVELSPDQVQRLPQAVLPQQTASIPVPGNQFPANFFRPGAQNGKNPGLSLVPLPGFPNLYRLPSGLNTYNQQPYYIPDPRSQAAPPRNPSGLGQTTQRPASPLFDNDILSKETSWSTARNIFTPDSPNLRVSGSSPSPSPSATPSPQPSPTAANPSPSPSSSLSPFVVGTPSPGTSSPGTPSPTPAPTSPTTAPSSPTIDPDLLAYNADGTGSDDATSNLKTWQEQVQSSGVSASGSPWQSLPLKVVAPTEATAIVEKAERPIRAIVGVVVDANGKIVGEPALIKSSGYKLLNQAAIDMVLAYEYSSTGANVPYLITLEFTL